MHNEKKRKEKTHTHTFLDPFTLLANVLERGDGHIVGKTKSNNVIHNHCK